jgi:hypothetical protein
LLSLAKANGGVAGDSGYLQQDGGYRDMDFEFPTEKQSRAFLAALPVWAEYVGFSGLKVRMGCQICGKSYSPNEDVLPCDCELKPGQKLLTLD